LELRVPSQKIQVVMSGSACAFRFLNWLADVFGQCLADVPDIVAMTFETMQYGRGLFKEPDQTDPTLRFVMLFYRV
jgi:hypothetical protein